MASSLSPLLHSFLEERLLANLRQQLWILRHVLFGRCDYFHRKNIFIDKTLSVVRGCFARCFVWFASPWRELCLPPDLWKTRNSKNDIFVSEENNACYLERQLLEILKKKKRKKGEIHHRMFPVSVVKWWFLTYFEDLPLSISLSFYDKLWQSWREEAVCSRCFSAPAVWNSLWKEFE